MNEAVSEWLALAIEEVDEQTLLPGIIGNDGTPPHLPTQMIKMPFENPSQIAVVSWRWDGDLKTRGSRNIASVVRCAKQRGIRYLFIDIISIDQTLAASNLIKRVAAFSTLYTKITVFAAYDMVDLDGEDMCYTVLRPWIMNEMRLFRQNPGRIIYAGHSNQGSERGNFHANGLIRAQREQTRFAHLLKQLWYLGIVDSIIGVLRATIDMACISDFKYIVPAYFHVSSVAYEQMERNDYLLTIALLCRVQSGSTSRITNQDLGSDVYCLRYSRYNFKEMPYSGHTMWCYYEICLDGARIARWKDLSGIYESIGNYELETYPDTERVIFAALRLSDLDYEKFVGQEKARRTSLLLDDTVARGTTAPTVEAVEVSGLFV